MKYIFSFLFLILLIQLKAYPQYEIKVVNQQLSTEEFQFDIVIKSNGEDFLLGSYQCIFEFNNELANSGPFEFRYYESSSELNNEPIITSIEDDEGTLKLCFAASAGADRISSDNIKIGSFVLFGNFQDQLNMDSLDLKWSFTGNIKTIIADAEFNDITSPEMHLLQDNPLPVELISFKAERSNDNVILHWETATELNNYGFELQRKSSGGSEYAVLGFIKSSGGNSNHKYKFTDAEALLPGRYIYRLKQIDNDGTFEYQKSIEVTIDKPLAYKLYQNYPNPFNPSTTIKYSLREKSRVELNIFDITGKLMRKISDNDIQESGVYSIEWTADNIASGIYICQLRTISIESDQLYSSIIKLILLK